MALSIDDFLLSFLATLGGVFVAFFLTLEYDRRRKASQEKQDLKRMITTIDLELDSNLKDLDIFRLSFNQRTIPLLLFRTGAYQSAISGGTFSILNPNLQGELTQHYDVGIRWIETLAAKLMAMLGTETAFQNWTKYSTFVNQLFTDGMKDLHDEIPHTRELLKNELKRLG